VFLILILILIGCKTNKQAKKLVPAMLVGTYLNLLVSNGTSGIFSGQGRPLIATVLSFGLELPLSIGGVAIYILYFHGNLIGVYWWGAIAAGIEIVIVLYLIVASDWAKCANEARDRQEAHSGSSGNDDNDDDNNDLEDGETTSAATTDLATSSSSEVEDERSNSNEPLLEAATNIDATPSGVLSEERLKLLAEREQLEKEEAEMKELEEALKKEEEEAKNLEAASNNEDSSEQQAADQEATIAATETASKKKGGKKKRKGKR
jgi:hypothetical protein